MQKQEVPDKPVTDEPRGPLWSAPEPPVLSGKERVVFFFERFGFLLAFVVTLVILVALFFNTELLLREPGRAPRQEAVAVNPEPVADPQTATESQPAHDATTVDKGALVAFSITTNPASAAIFIDGSFVGISPLRSYLIAEGTHHLSIQKQYFAPFDTALAVTEESSSLTLELMTMDETAREKAQQATDVGEEEDVSSPAETRQETPPATPSVTTDNRTTQAQRPSQRDEMQAPATRQEEPSRREPVSRQEPVTRRENNNTARVPATNRPAQEQRTTAATPKQETRPVGVVEIRSEPPGAAVFLDGRQVGVTPTTMADQAVGTHQVSLRLKGYETLNISADVVANQRAVVNGQLTQLLGTIKILAKPWGNIYIDGTLHKSEASFRYTTTLTPGDHRVRIEHPALGKWEQVVVITAGEERSITVDFNEGDSTTQ